MNKIMFSLTDKVSVEIRENMAFGEFLSSISGSEAAFLPQEELDRFVPACCAMANGTGGWVVFGAAPKEDDLPTAYGVRDIAFLEKHLTLLLRESRLESANLVSYFRILSDAGKKILAVRVKPAGWRLRPVRVGKEARAYRRVEGENVISGREIRWRMALDALETSRDDSPVPGLAMSDLDGESVASFRDKLTSRRPGWKALSMENFLKRTLVLDECGGVTRAGELLLGKNSNLVRFQKIQDVSNLWLACEVLLPRMSAGLTAVCAEALRECFVNAMLHAEHDAGVIDIELGDGTAAFSNPGLPRSSARGESEARNYRLMRIFAMTGLARGEGRGLDIIREYDAGFRLLWDMLKLATVSELALSVEAAFHEQTFHEPKKTVIFNPGWLPVVREEFTTPADAPVEIPETEIAEFEVPDDSQTASEEEDEYLGTPEDEEDVFSPLVRKVRDTPRLSPAVVRDAVLELCAEYRSLPDLASALARSESSLRRHYVTSMVKKGLIEMEFPDKAGHPDQRYRAKK